MNTELLETVAQYITDHPTEFDMGYWDCGTTACVAGHAARLNGRPLSMDGNTIAYLGEVTLGLPNVGVGNWRHLFYLDQWPEEFGNQYLAAEDSGSFQEMANVAAARIRHLIATGE